MFARLSLLFIFPSRVLTIPFLYGTHPWNALPTESQSLIPFPHADVLQIVYRFESVMFAEHRVVSIVCPVCHKTIGSTNSIAVHVNKEQSKVFAGEAKEYIEAIS